MADYKGGYQILDLTGATAGDPVTIGGIFTKIESNKGKPILIKANDGQRVFAQAKKSSSNYVITYLSAEGKTVKVTISNQDAVTTVIEDDGASIEALTQGLNEVADRVDSTYFGTAVSLDEYDGSTDEKIYTTPCDGWLYIDSTSSASGSANVQVKRTDNNSWTIVLGHVAANTHMSVFIKKGLNLKVSKTGTGFTVGFRVNQPLS